MRQYRLVGDRELRDLVRDLEAKFERIWASPYADGGKRSAPDLMEQLALPDTAPDPPTDWWRTVSDRPSRCGGCGQSVPPGDRFLYRHAGREVQCRTCAGGAWQSARPSKRLKEFAARRAAA